MKPSTRNQLPGTVDSVPKGEAMAVVKVNLTGSDHVITSSITKDEAEDLALPAGSQVVVLVKSTEVALAVERAKTGSRSESTAKRRTQPPSLDVSAAGLRYERMYLLTYHPSSRSRASPIPK